MGFLALKRSRGESIWLKLPDGRSAEIKVGDIKHHKGKVAVTLCIDAPRDIGIERDDICVKEHR